MTAAELRTQLFESVRRTPGAPRSFHASVLGVPGRAITNLIHDSAPRKWHPHEVDGGLYVGAGTCGVCGAPGAGDVCWDCWHSCGGSAPYRGEP